MVKLDKKNISMNPSLLDPKEVMIGKLKSKIEAFKKYDKERQAYYKDALIRLGELESYFEEVDANGSLRDIINRQRRELSRLLTLLKYSKIEDIPDVDLPKAIIEIDSLRSQLTKANAKIVRQQRSINDLIYKLNRGS